MTEVSLGGTPDIYEQPRGQLDLTFSQKLWHGMRFKAAAENLLNASLRKVHHYKGREFLSQRYLLGRAFTLGMSYSL